MTRFATEAAALVGKGVHSADGIYRRNTVQTDVEYTGGPGGMTIVRTKDEKNFLSHAP